MILYQLYPLPLHFDKTISGSHGGNSKPDHDIPKLIRLINAGKTTAVEILEGLVKPDCGTIRIFGQSWGNDNGRALRERFAVQLQETQFSERLSVLETVQLFRSFYKFGKDPEEIIRLLELNEKQYVRVGHLSGGQKQRLAIACALVSDPEILF